MKKAIPRALDDDVRNRVDEVNKKIIDSEEYTFEQLAEAFGSAKIRETLQEEKVFVPTFDEVRIRMSLPFNRHVYVQICPRCDCSKDINLVAPYVERAAFVPVLVAKYSAYPERFVRYITRIPHISSHEFHFYRHYSLVGQSDDGVICEHCVKLRQKKLLEKVKRIDKPTIRIVDGFFEDLSPIAPSDEGLLQLLFDALASGDVDRVFDLYLLSSTIHKLRTAEAYGGRVSLGLHELEKVPQELINRHGLLTGQSPVMRALLAEELGLLIPTKMPAGAYLDIVLPHRERLLSVVDQALKEAGDGKKASVASVVDCVGNINQEVQRFPHSRKFKAYRAAVSFAADHKAILGAMLAAGLFGLNGSLLGCLGSIAGGTGARILSKKFPIKVTNPQVKEFVDQVRKDLQPVFRGLLARYLGTNKLALEVWQMRQELVQRTTQVPGAKISK
jgi:hypothetical protein